LFDERAAITRTLGVIAILVILVAGAGVYSLGLGQSRSGSGPTDLSIVETDPVNQIDNFNPGNITVSHGTTVTLAIQNGDDVARTFVITAFNVNQTIDSGAAARITFTVGPPGVFPMFLPPAPAANGFRASPEVTGYFIVK
jgi:heme/copper-type cytochrome/quinol oxidase subunit 2